MPGEIRYIPTREADARHQAAKMTSPRGETRIPQQRNSEVVLSLGGTRYTLFRNKVYAVPMVSFPLGQKILELYVKTVTTSREVSKTGSKKASDDYYSALRALSRVMWHHMRHTSRVLRVLRRFGMTRNPLRKASDQELRDLTGFFLQGRMKSTVQSLPIVENLGLN
jgi:hypothetical protein